MLIVDDDPLVARALTRVLERAGLCVRVALTVEEALPLVAWCDLAMTDWDMHAFGGRDFIVKARNLRPGLPILVVSGSPVAEEAAHRHGIPFVAKPWNVLELLVAVRRMLSVEEDV